MLCHCVLASAVMKSLVHIAVSTTRSVDDPLCRRPAESTTRCVEDPMCPQPAVSKTRCVYSPLCRRPAASKTRCVHGPLCPRPDVSTARCVEAPMCLRPTHREIIVHPSQHVIPHGDQIQTLGTVNIRGEGLRTQREILYRATNRR